MKVEMAFVCPGCGQTVTRVRDPGQSAYFCSKKCYVKAQREGTYVQPKPTSESRFVRVKIRITKMLDLFKDFTPDVGKIYDAERYNGSNILSYVISVNGHRVNIRRDECEEVT